MSDKYKPVIVARTEELVATAERIPFGVEFRVNERWFSLSFVTDGAFFVQELGTQDPTEKFIKDARQKIRQWARTNGLLVDENQSAKADDAGGIE